MNKDVKKQWLEALRSGDFEQTVDKLHDETGFCCLGVLCQLSGLGEWDVSMNYKCATGVEDAYLPEKVYEWAGLTRNPEVHEECGVINLGDKNDSGSTFEEIADMIEEYF